MDVIRFYEGYSVNKNYFFAPASLKKPKSPLPLVVQASKPIGKGILHRMITSNGYSRKSKSTVPGLKETITPASLSFHIQKRSLASTPFPGREPRSGSQTGNSSTFRIRGKTKHLKFYRNSMMDEDYMSFNLNLKINLNLPNSYTSMQNAEVQT